MKKSEFIKEFKRRYMEYGHRLSDPNPREEAEYFAGVAANEAEEAVRDALKRTGHPAVGPWDPEEPKRPERVEVSIAGGPVRYFLTGVPTGGLGSWKEQRLLHEEAAARWNAVSQLLAEYGMATEPAGTQADFGSRLLRTLREEREKLK